MVALADLINLRGSRGAALWQPTPLKNFKRRYPAQLLEISSTSVHVCADEPVAHGENLRIELPAFGPVLVKVTGTGTREFRAEFCGPRELRLLFLPKLSTRHSCWFERLPR